MVAILEWFEFEREVNCEKCKVEIKKDNAEIEDFIKIEKIRPW